MRTDRRRGTALDVLTAHFAHPSGKTIEIIGVKHFASPQFWDLLQADLDSRRPEAAIHYESPLDDSSAWGAWTRLKSRIGRQIDRASHAVWKNGGLAFQFDSLVVRDHWENHDTTTSRTIRSMPIGLMLSLAVLYVPIAMIRPLATAVGRSNTRGLLAAAGKPQSLTGMLRTSIVVDEREEIAANAAMKAEQSVIIIWGHAHLPGLGRRFQRNGFELVSTSWRELFDLGATASPGPREPALPR
ncbi:hypothetical protein [Marisediminicola antarctica]|uniref:hypothetical protein n=1 Tax=Marisediminicola antarctica TaxID=674079 RepID=UPI00137B3F25|nr:hypothetical protein [Marisediminicola antarctica]